MNIVLLHKNLRISDNAALYNGCNSEKTLIIYAYDKSYWLESGRSYRQFKFCLDCLSQLTENLKKLNRKLFIFNGNLNELSVWIEKNYPQSKIFVNQSTDTKNYRDQFNSFKNFFLDRNRLNIFEDFGIQTQNFDREKWSLDWHKIMKKELLPAPNKSSTDFKKIPLGLLPFNNFKKTFLKNTSTIEGSFQPGGEDNARKLLSSFLKNRANGYSLKMSSPIEAESSCSRLSPHITFGSISLRTIFHELMENINSSPYQRDLLSFKKRLHWHCHFIQKLETEPELEFRSMHPMCDSLRDSENKELTEKWILGETGFPFLDACTTFLRKKGWINFRMRAMIMSFASYNLWQPWQRTSPLLAELFVDYEPGIHICQVQMQSGVTGINLPRIYSVLKQSKDQDPSATWIKGQLKSLKDAAPKNIHDAELIEIYHDKIVDLKSSARKAREEVWSIRKGSNFKKIAKEVYLKHGSRLKRA